MKVYKGAYRVLVLLGKAIANKYLLRYNKDNQNQRLNQVLQYPQRLYRCPLVVYFYALYRTLGRVMSVLFLMVLKRESLEGVGGLESLGLAGRAGDPI